MVCISFEVNILQSLEHRNIVQFFLITDTLTTIYANMESVAGKDLEMFLRNIDYIKEEEARPIFQQVVSTAHFLHQRHTAHRDIKLENILIDGAGKLCGFGMATQLAEGQMLEKFCGSLLYLASEILARKPSLHFELGIWLICTGHRVVSICRNHPSQAHHHQKVSHSLPLVKTLSQYHCIHGPHPVQDNNMSAPGKRMAGPR